VLMVPFLFPDAFDLATQRANYDYYEARTLHKSSLSPAIHAIVGLQVGDASKAERYFARSAFVDLDDNQGNTDEGIHIASAGGTWQVAVLGFGGLRLRGDVLHLTPQLPDSWERLTFSVCRPAGIVRVDLGHLQHRFTWEGMPGSTVSLCVDGTAHDLSAGAPLTVASSTR
ncbi:MAG: hypothetical protein Q7T55_07350, partial [Solirubrobacteraceae bacterium]|nr:hypothetical protein [Solirubrobacteraceae bacterium]